MSELSKRQRMDKKFEKIANLLHDLKSRSEKGEVITSQDWDNLNLKVSNYERIISLGDLQTSSLHFDEIEKQVKKEVKALLNCELVLIYRFNKKENHLSVRVTPEGAQVAQYFFTKIDETSFAGSCASVNATQIIQDVSTDIRYAKIPKAIREKVKCKNMLMTPLIYEGELLGVIQAINSQHGTFEEDDVFFLEAIAAQLASVMEKNYLYEKLQEQFIQVVQALADSIGKKDLYTGGHTKRVAIFAEKIGRELGLSYKDLQDLKIAAILHDIGKIGIEDKILKKKAPLTKEEFEIMKNHPRLGYEILGHIDGLEEVIDGMRFHHERPDGKGYPYGLDGKDIPVIAHIISVADTFDAMISTRPYRKGLPPMEAYDEICKNAGTQFEESVVEAFKRFFEKSTMFKSEKVERLKKVG